MILNKLRIQIMLITFFNIKLYFQILYILFHKYHHEFSLYLYPKIYYLFYQSYITFFILNIIIYKSYNKIYIYKENYLFCYFIDYFYNH